MYVEHKILPWHRILYDLGYYRFTVPPTCGEWSDDSWIRWISSCDGWLPNGGKIPYFMPKWLRLLNVILKDDKHYDAGTMLDKETRNGA